jgi:hypothetical protein
MENKIKVKMLKYYGEYVDDYTHLVLRDITSWDEVTEDEYQKLKRWINIKNQENRLENEFYILFRQDDYDFNACIADYLKRIEEEEKKAAEAKRKREEAKQLRAAKKNKLQEAEEKALLKQLKNKYEADQL